MDNFQGLPSRRVRLRRTLWFAHTFSQAIFARRRLANGEALLFDGHTSGMLVYSKLQQKVAKVTISLPKALLAMADRIARERSTTRSGVIADLLEKEEEARIQAIMEEGYREMAEENCHLAEEAFRLTSETIKRHTR